MDTETKRETQDYIELDVLPVYMREIRFLYGWTS